MDGDWGYPYDSGNLHVVIVLLPLPCTELQLPDPCAAQEPFSWMAQLGLACTQLMKGGTPKVIQKRCSV